MRCTPRAPNGPNHPGLCGALQDIDDFNAAILRPKSATASVDFTTVASWQPLIKSLFAREIQGNLLRLVHLSHKYKLLGPATSRQTLAEGETIASEVRVASVTISPGGKEIVAVGTLHRGAPSRRREFCHSADALSPSLLIHLLKVEGVAAE